LSPNFTHPGCFARELREQTLLASRSKILKKYKEIKVENLDFDKESDEDEDEDDQEPEDEDIFCHQPPAFIFRKK
jgi:hypothetical protein